MARTIGRIVRSLSRVLSIFRRTTDRKTKPESRKALVAEIAKLESRLDRIYAQLARGDKDQGIEGLVSQASDIREQLRWRRARLSRLSRQPHFSTARKLSSKEFDVERAVQKIVDDSYRLRRRAFSRTGLAAIGLGGVSEQLEYEDEDEIDGLEYESPLENGV